MNVYSNLWQAIISNVAEIRGIPKTRIHFRSDNNLDIVKLYSRAAQIFTLELVLHEHRAKYATNFEPLKGIKALHHKVYIETGWNIDDIKKMTLSSNLLVLQEYIRVDKLPLDAQEYLSNLPEFSMIFDNFLKSEWKSEENAIFLENITFDKL